TLNTIGRYLPLSGGYRIWGIRLRVGAMWSFPPRDNPAGLWLWAIAHEGFKNVNLLYRVRSEAGVLVSLTILQALAIKKKKQLFTPKIMSDTNGYTNGMTNGHNGCNSEPVGQHWTVGLLNSQCRYLTAESFGFKVNANGVGLKKKQLWTLEPYGDDDSVCLRSHLDRYLSVDHFGNVTCESEEKLEGVKFFVAVANDGTGRWALRNAMRGYFLGAANDKLLCSAKVPGPAELWTVHLAARPQVNIRSVGRRRYARLSTDHEAIHVDANTPWGEDTLFTLEFHEGKYAIHTCNDKYLKFDGSLSETLVPECLFTLEFHSGYLALRDNLGRYVAPLGSRAVLKTRSQTVTKDELFFLEDSVPQAAFVAFNGKYVSVKQGVDVTANQDEISDHEIFQLEYDISSKKWCVRTMQDKYWSLQSSSGIQANADKGYVT
ncbi:unnamed protein product, partial [Larinioides sclopetarius]